MGDGPNGVPAGVGTCKTIGPVVATLTWTGPAGTEPPAVVVKETSSVAWTGDSGSCDPGLPLASSSTGPNGEGKTGLRYTVYQSSGHSFALAAVSARANAAHTSAPSSPLLAGNCSVNYSVDATPVTIESSFAVPTLQTGKPDLFNFLVGQQADFRVGCGSYTPQAFPWNLGSNFVRGVSLVGAGTTTIDGNTYPYYDRRETDSGFDPSVPTPSVFYEGMDRTFQATCTLSLFAGTQNIGSVTVIRDVKVYVPTRQLVLSHGSCTIWDADDRGEHDAEWAEARDRSVSGDGVKIRNSTALPPGSPFLAYQGQGQWAFAQKFARGYEYGGYASYALGLDNSYPYAAVYDNSSNSLINPPWLPTGSTNCYLYDAPAISISWTHHYGDDFQADSYGVFRPPHFPGQATVDMPMFVVHWEYSSSSDRLANNPTGTARWANESSYRSFASSRGTEWIATPSFSSLIMSTPRTPVASTEMDWSHVNMNN